MASAIVLSLVIVFHLADSKSSSEVQQCMAYMNYCGLCASLKDYCPTDSFDAHCHPNESIVVTSAQYGRMRSGTCLDGKGYTGCVADVRSHLANLCSGRQRCTVAVSSLASVVQPCDRDFVSYLEASYTCVNVVADSSEGCFWKMHEISSSHGFLVNPTVYGSTIGTKHCPFVFPGFEWQHIQLRVSVYGETKDDTATSIEDRPRCSSIIHITENESVTRESLCVVGVERDFKLYESSGNQLNVYFENKSPVNSVFLVEFRVIGCADVPVSEDMKVVRRGNDLLLRCNKNLRETWYLTCQDNRWVGEMGNCSRPRTSEVAHGLATPIPFPQGLILAVSLGVFLGMVIGFASLALLYIHRRREFHRRNDMLNENALGNYETGDLSARRRCQTDSKESSSLLYDTTHLPTIESGRRMTKPNPGMRIPYRDAVGKQPHVYEGQRVPTDQPVTEIYFDLDPQQGPHRQSM